jgi:steroid 5-alpha reductase family enzyme
MLIGSYRPLGYEDLIVGSLLLICIGLETLADEQQWIYQNAKKASPSKSTRSHSREAHLTSYCQPEDLSRGFITGGLWRYSRHPNFACEQAIWGLFYAWGCVATVLPPAVFENQA